MAHLTLHTARAHMLIYSSSFYYTIQYTLSIARHIHIAVSLLNNFFMINLKYTCVGGCDTPPHMLAPRNRIRQIDFLYNAYTRVYIHEDVAAACVLL